MDIEMLNKAIVARLFASFWGASYDPAVVDELTAPHVLLQYSMNNPSRGRPAVKAFMVRFRAAFPNFEFRRLNGPADDHATFYGVPR